MESEQNNNKKLTHVIEMLLRFVDQIYVNTFRNLTDDGSVSHSHEFFSLFPDFSQLSDPRSVAIIPQVSYSRLFYRKMVIQSYYQKNF
jgi:hypothetical protein